MALYPLIRKRRDAPFSGAAPIVLRVLVAPACGIGQALRSYQAAVGDCSSSFLNCSSPLHSPDCFLCVSALDFWVLSPGALGTLCTLCLPWPAGSKGPTVLSCLSICRILCFLPIGSFGSVWTFPASAGRALTRSGSWVVGPSFGTAPRVTRYVWSRFCLLPGHRPL